MIKRGKITIDTDLTRHSMRVRMKVTFKHSVRLTLSTQKISSSFVLNTSSDSSYSGGGYTYEEKSYEEIFRDVQSDVDIIMEAWKAYVEDFQVESIRISVITEKVPYCTLSLSTRPTFKGGNSTCIRM